MRVLGIETSSRRGTVALVENGATVLSVSHDVANAHGERIRPLVDEALAAAGWPKTSLDRVAVGTGPGSFTGLRVGIALAQGIGLGLGRPVLGVGSLRAMCRGVPVETPGLRCALLDARRDELFLAAYDEKGMEFVAAQARLRAGVRAYLNDLGVAELVLVGEVPEAADGVHSALTDLPHAACVALLGGELPEPEGPVEPLYVRDADAIRPNLPRSPLSSEPPT